MRGMDFQFPWNKKQKEKDSVYFNSKNTEIVQLEQELESMKVPQQKEAMKEIIAGMTLGKDVSRLLPHVVNCMRTNDLELKKLIYLYIINYAKVKPGESILAVNSFLLDANDVESPIIRALAIRTMGCIRVEEIVSYLCETLKNGLNDSDAYVKKTSCICVAKLYSTCPELVKDNGLIEQLQNMLDDGNATVLSSAIAALSEISLLSGVEYLKLNSKILKKILMALNDANEWGQIYILDALMSYKKTKPQKSEMIIEAVVPLFNHINPAVIMSAIKVVLKFLDFIEDEKKVQNYSKKLSLCLISLMDSVPEMRYLLLRAMHCIIQKRHYLFDKDFKSFFIKAYEPIYVKFEKLDILYKLCDNSNYEMILNELSSYSVLEYDMELVQKAIKYIGLIGYKFENSMNICVDNLQHIFQYNQDFTIDQGVIVMRDLLRKYEKEEKPKQLLKIIDEKFIEKIRLPESKKAILYIIGEYCKKIKKSTEYINIFFNDFSTLNEIVQVQILNAGVKNFLKKSNDKSAEELAIKILQKCVEESVNADVRDRGYFYWRLLETDPDLAKEMICCEKISFDSLEDQPMEQDLCEDVLQNITNMSCIYHMKSSDIIKKEDLLLEDETTNTTNEDSDKEKEKEKEKEEKNEKEEDNEEEEKDKEKDDENKKKKKKKNKKAKINKDKTNQMDVDLLGINDIINFSNTNEQNENNNNIISENK
jgi:vesicle coat complex subunit